MSLESFVKNGGTLEKTLDTVIINAFAIIVDQENNERDKENDARNEEHFPYKRVYVLTFRRNVWVNFRR